MRSLDELIVTLPLKITHPTDEMVPAIRHSWRETRTQELDPHSLQNTLVVSCNSLLNSSAVTDNLGVGSETSICLVDYR